MHNVTAHFLCLYVYNAYVYGYIVIAIGMKKEIKKDHFPIERS